MRKNMKEALGKSLESEERAVRSRFDRADEAMATDAEAVKQPSPKQPKIIRDSFTIPEQDYGLFDELKRKFMKIEIAANKSELVRAGLYALRNMDDDEARSVFEGLTKMKPGRQKIG